MVVAKDGGSKNKFLENQFVVCLAVSFLQEDDFDLVVVSSCVMYSNLILLIHLSVRISGLLALNEECHQNWTDVTIGDTHTIQSPKYPAFYPDNADCFWSFTSFDYGQFVIVIEELNLISSTNVDCFVLGVADNTEIFKETSFISPGTTFIANDKRLWIRFTSDEKLRFKGFSVQISRIEARVYPDEFCSSDKLCSNGQWCKNGAFICAAGTDCLYSETDIEACATCNSNDFWCKSGFGCVNQSMVCDHHLDCLDGSDEFDCQKTCSNGWIGFENYCYIINSTKVSWPEAEQICSDLDANLISIHSDVEQKFLEDLINSEVNKERGYAIGLTDRDQEGVFQWTDGSPVDYTNWYPGEPNNAVNEDCVAVRSQEIWFFEWNDFYCYEVGGYICKKPKETCGTQRLSLENSKPIYITSPNFPNNNAKQLDCIWYISAIEDSGFFVIRFFRMYRAIDNNNDQVSVGVGHDVRNMTTMVATYGMTVPPNILVVQDPNLWIRFITDSRIGYSGFFLVLKRTNEEVTCQAYEFQCSSGYDCIDASLRCSALSQCSDQSDEWQCDFCGSSSIDLTHANDVYHLNSIPPYPYNYQNNQHCKWFIKAPSDGFIEFKFIKFHLEPRYDFFLLAKEIMS
ncbi:uncharacterized protein [Amphiura filiformis]|uniref:uncharacterized protein n=1 Tax=Amphiura filiformis TaxID=82378 RepID=UPI003B2195A9